MVRDPYPAPRYPAPRLCTHHYCRCIRAAELATIADRTGNNRYLADALEAHSQTVACRLLHGGDTE